MKHVLPVLLLLLFAFTAPAALANDPPDDDTERMYWQQRTREVHAAHRQALDRFEAAENSYRSMRSRGKARGDKKATILAEYEEARAALTEAEQELDAFPDEARRAGALPGWIRPPDDAGPAAPR